MEHNRWESIQAQAFFRFWGHAARLPADRRSPLSLVLAVRNEDWLARNGHKHKRCLGFWPNAARFLQKALEANRMIGQPPYWYQAALDRPTCDLHGHMLLQVGEKFRLLAMRHPPVEEPYPSAYKYVAPTDCNDDVQAVVFCSDGSSKLAHGSYGVVILAPYAELGSAIVAQGRVDGYCTNIRAEIVAACQAFTLIKQFKYYCPLIPVIFLTDSEYVLQLLDETLQPTCHVPDTNNLTSIWQSLCTSVSAKHVKAHKGHALNELADRAAKEAYFFNHFRRVVRDVHYNRVYLLRDHQPNPQFHKWL